MSYTDLKKRQGDDFNAVLERAESIYGRRPKIRPWAAATDPDVQHYYRLAEQELWGEGRLNFEPEDHDDSEH